ncbi:MAG TPA: hypothetical protein V6D17_22130 [Candidatus Obscuribacterales bacterium]
MDPKSATFFSHRIVRIATFCVMFALSVGALLWYADSRGGVTNPFDESSAVTWLTRENLENELGLKADASGNVTASPDTVVLIIECVPQSCDAESLNLPRVIKAYDGKVKILALNPYKDPLLTQFVEQQLIAPVIQRQFAMQLALSYAEQFASANNTEVTDALIQSILGDPSFQALYQQQLQQLPILKQAYPKYFIFSAQDFELLAATIAIQMEDDLVSLIDTVLNALSVTPPSQTAPASKNGSASPGTPVATAIPVTPTPFPQSDLPLGD